MRQHRLSNICLMTLASPLAFQIHWSLVPREQSVDLAPAGYRLLAVWPAPVNHDVCFEAAGFTLFADNDEPWHRAADDFLQQVIDRLSGFGAFKLMSAPLKAEVAWYLRPFRTPKELPLQQQALLPMQYDDLPWFHAQFGTDGASLWTGGGHYLLWLSLPDTGPDPSEFVRSVARYWEVI